MATLTPFLQLYKPVAKELGWDDNMNANLDTIDGFVKQFMNIPGFVGTWVNSHLYAVGNIVLDTANASFYRCVTSHTSAATGTFAADRIAKPNGWALTTSPAQDSAAAAAASATSAANSAASATTQLTTFQNTYYGAFATAPLNDPHGGARTAGDLYFDSTTQTLNVWTGTAWFSVNAAFADAPTTAPTTNVYVRGGDHTWKLGVGSAGGVFTGDVIFGTRTTVGFAMPSIAAPGLGFSQHFNANLFGIGLYFSLTPSPNGSFRYMAALPQGTVPPALPTATVGNTGALITGQTANGIRTIDFYFTPKNEVATIDGVANIFRGAFLTGDNVPGGPPISNFVITGAGFQPGGGLWRDSSDARIKNVVGPYPHGLAELLEMLPQMFTYKGNDQYIGENGDPGDVIHVDTLTQHIGLIAQDCEPYMPELVTTTTAYIDGVLQTDVREINATGIIYALVNAVAELDARLKALEP